jgi:DNA-binding PucR family transcriptional regulator
VIWCQAIAKNLTKPQMSNISAESYIVQRLKDHGAFIYPVSDQFPLKERIRRAILDGKHDATIIGGNSATKKCETYAECFARLYNEPLEPKQPKGKKHAQATI